MARFQNGYIKLHRSAYFGDIGTNIYCWGLWTALLVMATYMETTIISPGQRRKKIPPGTVIIGQRELADRLGCSKDTVTRWLEYLKNTDRVRVETSPRGTVITILNWKQYQGRDDDSETLAGHDTPPPPGHDTPPVVGHSPTLTEERKNQRKNIEISAEKISKCVEAWGKTLKRLEVNKDPRLDEVAIARLIQTHGEEKAYLALLGAGYEEPGKDYNPKKHVRITRLLKPEIFDLFVNLGAQTITRSRQIYNPDTGQYEQEAGQC